MNISKMLENEFYGCTTLKLCSQRCDGPERHEMLTVINAYYGYCKILQVCQVLHYTSFNINVKFKVQHFQLVIH